MENLKSLEIPDEPLIDIGTAFFMGIIDASLSSKGIPFRLIAAHNLLHFYF